MLAYSLSALIAFTAAMSELVARYQDAPRKAVFTVPGFFYLTVNGLAAALAYLLIVEVFVLDFGLTDAESLKRDAYRVLLASLGSMAFFRSSLFNVRVGDSDIAVGPAGILQIFLSAADRAVDRARATPRALLVNKTMNGIDFDKAWISLPPFCFQLMQNVTAEEQTQFGRSIEVLRNNAEIDGKVKSLILGLSLLSIVGESVLTAAVETLRDHISE